jgi:aminoglycoside/choline kinase family phosphotransferase
MRTLAENMLLEQELINLADKYLPDVVQREKEITAHRLHGDAGFRNYFRLSTDPSVLGVYADSSDEDWVAFMRVSHVLESLGVRVPKIYTADLRAEMLVIEDLGDELYQNSLIDQDTQAIAERLYPDAINALAKIQLCEDKPAWLPRYSGGLLRQEMELFSTWFVQKLLNYPIDASESMLIASAFKYLVSQSLAQPQVLVHRDYHCRNLLDIGAGGPGIIDFQDAVWGPVTYDLVSLSRDVYLRWHRSTVDFVRDEFATQLLERGVIDEEGVASFPSWFESMSAQRHLKVLGIFGRLALRDGKTEYLNDMPLALRYLLETCEQDPALQNFTDWIKTVLLPLIEKQDWYVDWHRAGDDKTVW